MTVKKKPSKKHKSKLRKRKRMLKRRAQLESKRDQQSSSLLHNHTSSNSLSKMIGASICLYFIGFILAHVHARDFVGFVDMLYLSNMAVLIGGVGMIFSSVSVIGVSIVCVAFSHTSFVYDLMYWLLWNQFPVGSAGYLEELDLSPCWFFTLHKLWYMPLCFVVLYKEYKNETISIKSWYFATGLNIFMVSVAYYIISTPHGSIANSQVFHQDHVYNFSILS
eukprot:TRINITY_DN988_c0_g1_i1.p1 TRINITY_DN988_c0_g1~~TRINITY_DN988_c0_g1_i1.p1  ORF type:complete len:222 (-),score=17.03 TRINITY_DN988_c0_g1_i1:323-988(-)